MSMSVTDSYTKSQTRLHNSVTELNVATALWRRNAVNARLAAEGTCGHWFMHSIGRYKTGCRYGDAYRKRHARLGKEPEVSPQQDGGEQRGQQVKVAASSGSRRKRHRGGPRAADCRAPGPEHEY